MVGNEFEIKGVKFQLRKVHAMKQFHIVRRIAPLLGELIPALSLISKTAKADLSESAKLDQFAEIAKPLFTGLGKLSDADSEKVLFGLLSAVDMKQSTGNWAAVATDTMIMFDNLELPILLELAGKAFAFNLSGFFAVLPSVS